MPAPSHVRASVAVAVPAGQDGGAHSVPAAYSWQRAAPSHTPSLAQLAAPCRGTARRIGAAGHDRLQVPGAARSAHDRHVPAHAVRQHTPWAQMPLAHSPPCRADRALGLRPHEPPMHTPGGAQSASAVHVDLQAAVPQRNGKHEVAAGREHVPAPSQLAAAVNVVVFAGQVRVRQGVPCA